MRSFFPTGLAFYTYSRALYDGKLSFEDIAEDYFSFAFGEDQRAFYDYLKELSDTFDQSFLSGRKSKNTEISRFYNPEKIEDFKRIPEITARGLELIKAHYNSDYRLRTVSVRLLEYHAEYANLLAEAMIPKCIGDDEGAKRGLDKLVDKMGAHEVKIERYYDHCLAINALKANIFSQVSNPYMDVEDNKKKRP